MGRYKRTKKYNYQGTASSTSKRADDERQSDFFLPAAQEQLKEYLIAYRDGCKQVCHGNGELKHTFDNLVVIGNQPFPPLTKVLLSKPYLSLPHSLSNKQRRDVHKLCVDVDLYHCGIGLKHSDNRCIAISIHSDGLSRHPDMHLIQDNQGSMQYCKPWFYGNGNKNGGDTTPTVSNSSISLFVEEATNQAKHAIETLIDQPGNCLRNAHDSIHFQELEKYDLSGIPPPAQDDGNWVLVDSAQKMKDCAQELIAAMPSVIAFDMEMWNVSKYTQVTCLMQITSDAGKEYVIDPLAQGVWENVALLNPLFSDPSIVKIGHSIGGLDTQSLHRDFGIFVLNAFDTYEAALVLRLKQAGLAAVCRHYGLVNSELYASLKEEYQRTDWRRRPITEPMLRYGRYDIHYLIALRTLMIRDLVRIDLWDDFNSKQDSQTVAKALLATLQSIEREEGDVESDDGDMRSVVSAMSDDEGYFTADETDEDRKNRRNPVASTKELRLQPDLMKVITTSQRRCLDFWTNRDENHEKNAVLVDLLKRSAIGSDVQYTTSNLDLLEQLMAWRRRVSKKEQCLPTLICSVDLLVNTSWKQPTNEADLRRIVYILPEFLEDTDKSHLMELLEIVRKHVLRQGLPLENKARSYDVSLENKNDDEELAKRRRFLYGTLTMFVIGAALAGITLVRRRR